VKVLIVEDEKSAAKRIISLLQEIDPQIQVTQVVDTVKKTVEWFKAHPAPDLLFLDIQLADGLSFEIFDKVEINCPVIFTTAYDQYALRAFEVYSLDYLLKPIDGDKLIRAIDKYNKIIGHPHQKLDTAILQNALEMIQGKSFKERFIVKYGEHIKSIPSDQIYCFFSEEKITFLKTYEGRKFVVDYTIEQIESLIDPAQFFRINRKYIINVEAIEDVVIYSNSRLKLIVKHFHDMDMIVAREKVQSFKRWLDQ
jgi:DNA-binding LytR/AlgR family response regulator